MAVKVKLRVPSAGLKRGDVIEVKDAATADALVANGTAARVKAEKSAQD